MKSINVPKHFKNEEDNLISHKPDEISNCPDNKENAKISPIPPKHFKYSMEDEENIEKIQNDEEKKKFLWTADFRFFDVHNLDDRIDIIQCNKNPNKNLVKLFNDMGIIPIIPDDAIESNLSGNNGICSQSSTEIELERHYKAWESGVKKDASKSRNSPKLIFYIDFEKSDLEHFFILSFLSRINTNGAAFVAVMGDDCIITRLMLGMNYIYLSKSLFTAKGIGLLPIENSAISTKGLYWDVSHWDTQFGSSNLSTSNELAQGCDECSVCVEKGQIFFTAAIDPENIDFLSTAI